MHDVITVFPIYILKFQMKHILYTTGTAINCLFPRIVLKIFECYIIIVILFLFSSLLNDWESLLHNVLMFYKHFPKHNLNTTNSAVCLPNWLKNTDWTLMKVGTSYHYFFFFPAETWMSRFPRLTARQTSVSIYCMVSRHCDHFLDLAWCAISLGNFNRWVLRKLTPGVN